MSNLQLTNAVLNKVGNWRDAAISKESNRVSESKKQAFYQETLQEFDDVFDYVVQFDGSMHDEIPESGRIGVTSGGPAWAIPEDSKISNDFESALEISSEGLTMRVTRNNSGFEGQGDFRTTEYRLDSNKGTLCILETNYSPGPSKPAEFNKQIVLDLNTQTVKKGFEDSK